MDGQKDGWMNRWTDRLLAGRMDGRTDGWMDGWMDGLQLWLAERSNPAAFWGSKWGVSAPQHNQGGGSREGRGPTAWGGGDICPGRGCVSPRRVLQAGTLQVSPPLLSWVSRPRLQATSWGFDAIGFSRRSSKARRGDAAGAPSHQAGREPWGTSPSWALPTRSVGGWRQREGGEVPSLLARHGCNAPGGEVQSSRSQ